MKALLKRTLVLGGILLTCIFVDHACADVVLAAIDAPMPPPSPPVGWCQSSGYSGEPAFDVPGYSCGGMGYDRTLYCRYDPPGPIKGDWIRCGRKRWRPRVVLFEWVREHSNQPMLVRAACENRTSGEITMLLASGRFCTP